MSFMTTAIGYGTAMHIRLSIRLGFGPDRLDTSQDRPIFASPHNHDIAHTEADP
jgi:hypothetical protein